MWGINKKVESDLYDKFAVDYISVVRLLQQDLKYKEVKDYGLYNTDRAAVYLGRFKENLLIEALRKESKVLTIRATGRGWFVLSIPRESSLGEHRTYQAEYIQVALSRLGYTSCVVHAGTERD